MVLNQRGKVDNKIVKFSNNEINMQTRDLRDLRATAGENKKKTQNVYTDNANQKRRRAMEYKTDPYVETKALKTFPRKSIFDQIF